MSSEKYSLRIDIQHEDWDKFADFVYNDLKQSGVQVLFSKGCMKVEGELDNLKRFSVAINNFAQREGLFAGVLRPEEYSEKELDTVLKLADLEKVNEVFKKHDIKIGINENSNSDWLAFVVQPTKEDSFGVKISYLKSDYFDNIKRYSRRTPMEFLSVLEDSLKTHENLKKQIFEYGYEKSPELTDAEKDFIKNGLEAVKESRDMLAKTSNRSATLKFRNNKGNHLDDYER